MNWRYLAFAVPQAVIAAAVGGVILYTDPSPNKGGGAAMVAFGIGFIVAYIVTIVPLKLLDWLRSRRALRSRASLRQEPDHGNESAWSDWPGFDEGPEVLDVFMSEEPRELGRVLPKAKPRIAVPNKGHRLLR